MEVDKERNSEKEKVRQYNREYYLRRQEEIKKARKDRYWNDPQYRVKVKKLARQRYDSVGKSEDARIGYTVKKAEGKELFSITYASEVSNRKEDTLRSWEKSGHIPKTIYTDTRGWRLYTAEQIKLLSYAFNKFDSGLWTKDILKQYLFNHWEKEENENA